MWDKTYGTREAEITKMFIDKVANEGKEMLEDGEFYIQSFVHEKPLILAYVYTLTVFAAKIHEIPIEKIFAGGLPHGVLELKDPSKELIHIKNRVT